MRHVVFALGSLLSGTVMSVVLIGMVLQAPMRSDFGELALGLGGAGGAAAIAYSDYPSMAAPSQAELDAVAVRQYLQHERIGQYSVDWQDTVEMGKTTTVKLRISPEVESSSRPETLRVAPFMTARLSGSDFDIDPAGQVDQVLVPDGNLEWTWHLSPKKSGQHLLALSVAIRIPLEGRVEQSNVLNLENTVSVHEDLGQRVEHWALEQKQWIVTSLLVPLFGYAFKHWRGRRYVSNEHTHAIGRRRVTRLTPRIRRLSAQP